MTFYHNVNLLGSLKQQYICWFMFRADASIKVGDVVNIFGEFDSNGYICIDMTQNNIMVVNPDYLVSGSIVASATTCVRRWVCQVSSRLL